VKEIDHLVLLSTNGKNTENEFKSIGIIPRRQSEDKTKKMIYTFYRPSSTILEVLSPLEVSNSESCGSSTAMGITFSCNDLIQTQAFLSEYTKPPWPAVQKGRQITTLTKELKDNQGENSFSLRLAFISPHIKHSSS